MEWVISALVNNEWVKMLTVAASVFAAVGVYVQIRQHAGAQARWGLSWTAPRASAVVVNGVITIDVELHAIGAYVYHEIQAVVWGEDLETAIPEARRTFQLGDDPLKVSVSYQQDRSSELPIWVGVVWSSPNVGGRYQQGVRHLYGPTKMIVDQGPRGQEYYWGPRRRLVVIDCPGARFPAFRKSLRFYKVGRWKDLGLIDQDPYAVPIPSRTQT